MEQLRTIFEAVTANLPSDWGLTQAVATPHIKKWQMFLFPMLENPLLDSQMFVEGDWPPLVNELIAQLIVYDLIKQKFEESTMNGMAGTTSSNTTVTSKGNLKKVEAGPSVVEWYDQKTSTSNLLKNIMASGNNGKTFFDILKENICMLSKRVKISLPTLCGTINKTHIFIVGRREIWRSPFPEISRG